MGSAFGTPLLVEDANPEGLCRCKSRPHYQILGSCDIVTLGQSMTSTQLSASADCRQAFAKGFAKRCPNPSLSAFWPRPARACATSASSWTTCAMEEGQPRWPPTRCAHDPTRRWALPIAWNELATLKQYGSEQQCREVLAKVRWSKGFCCQACGHTGRYQLKGRDVYQCNRFKRQVSLTRSLSDLTNLLLAGCAPMALCRIWPCPRGDAVYRCISAIGLGLAARVSRLGANHACSCGFRPPAGKTSA